MPESKVPDATSTMSAQPLSAAAATPAGGPPHHLAALASLGEVIARERDPAALLGAALAGMVDALAGDAAAARIDPAGGAALEAAIGPIALGDPDRVLAALGRAVEDAGAAGALEDSEIRRLMHAEWGIEPRSVLCAPIHIAGGSIGLVVLLNPCFGGTPAPADRAFLDAAALKTGLAAAQLGLGRTLSEAAATARELALAATIQERLLPAPDPARSPVQGLNRPIRKVSGDFYDYFERADGCFAFALGDVSGKGINAALMMSRAASLFRCLAKSIDDPGALMRALNREIREAASRGMFVTMVAGVYDPRTGRARFANAGHEPPLLRRPDRSYASFEADAPPLGILDDIAAPVEEVEVGSGELYMFSDGLTEFAYGEDEMLGVAGLIQMVEVSTGTPLSERLEALLADLECDGWAARDDLTVLTIDGNWIRRDD